MGFGRALAVGVVGLAAASFTSANGVHNAGITWSSGHAIHGANADGSGRHVLVPQIADGEGDPAWTRDGRAFAFFGRNSDDVWIHVRWPGTHRELVLRPDHRSPQYRVYAYVLEPTCADALIAPFGLEVGVYGVRWTLEIGGDVVYQTDCSAVTID